MANDTMQNRVETESIEMVSEDKQQEIMEKYDNDASTRNPSGIPGMILKATAIAMACFHIYTAVFGMMEAQRHRAMHLSFVLALGFMMYPALKKKKTKNPTVADWILALAGAVSSLYIVVNYNQIFLRGGIPNQMDIIMGITLSLVILECVRRVVGIQLLIIAVVFIAYAYLGRYMPGIFKHRGASITRMVDHLYMTVEGIFSTALGTSATYITLFVIFAAFLERSGFSNFIKDIAMALAGGAVGGPAKVSVVTSAAFGTISGSAAANVVTTGAFTIPLMKDTGYPKEFAAAVEAVASTGGQLMPPIMGSAAFIMADYLGIAYIEIIKAAIIPVGLYYASLFFCVHFRARKLGLKGLSREYLPNAWEVMKERGHLIIPFLVVVALLVKRFTPLYAGAVGIVAAIAAAAIKKETRLGVKDIIWALENGAKRSVSVAVSCASVGFVIGVCTLTGISTILGNYILEIGRGNLMLTAILVMFLSIVMGMGLPTVAVYVLLVSVAVPVIATFQVPLLAAHFFVFYFGLMANVTPPVAIPAYAAAGLANSNPSRTGWTAFRLALSGYLVPYLFLYNPHILMVDANIVQIIYAVLSPALGIFLLSVCTEGFFMKNIKPWERVLAGGAALAAIAPGIITDLMAVGIFLFLLLKNRRIHERQIKE